jgi:hypothetical protein
MPPVTQEKSVGHPKPERLLMEVLWFSERLQSPIGHQTDYGLPSDLRGTAVHFLFAVRRLLDFHQKTGVRGENSSNEIGRHESR